MNVKPFLMAGLAFGLAVGIAPSLLAQQTEIFSSGTLDGIIPDGNLSGYADTMSVTMPDNYMSDIQVTIDLVGLPNANNAYNGDYYAYLQSSSGLDVLLNRIDNGSGNNPGSGFNFVTFSDSAAGSIQTASMTAGAALTGSYQPDNSLDATFAGANPNDNWTLFIADESSLDEGELVSWSMQVTVPDNGSTLFMFALGALALAACAARRPQMARQKMSSTARG